MFLKKIALSVALLSTSMAYAGAVGPASAPLHKLEIDLSWLNLQPMSNNHVYAFYVSGTQPYFQDWHAQSVDPAYTSAFELGLIYHVEDRPLNASLYWLHLNSTDSANKQGNQTTAFADIEFVAPPFEMSPPVFGVRRADAELHYNFDDLNVNLEKIVSVSDEWLQAKIIAGVNFLHVKQSLTTLFSDMIGAGPTPYSYPLPPDPSFTFQLQSVSNFVGAGPDLALSGKLNLFRGLSLVGTAFASLNVGTTSVQENFTATSAKLTSDGIGVSKQQITTPNKTQIVPGFDGKLGLLYEFKNFQQADFSVEAGYRVLTYLNAISTTTPQTLVQPGTNPGVPEFSTGTMAIVSMIQQDRPFYMNGPYLTAKIRLC